MFIKRNKKLNKRGFTLAESVLALAIISLVSVGTLTLILSAQKSIMSAAQKQQAQLYAADIISCYRTDNFIDNANFALGIDNFELDKDIKLQGDLLLHASISDNPNTLQVIIKNSAEKPLVVQYFTKGGTQNEEVTQ